MTEIITESFYDKFMDLCANSRRSIRLCAPFVKNDVVENIINVRQASTTVDLITKNFKATESAVYMIKTTNESVAKEFEVANEFSSAFNKKVLELASTGQFQSNDVLWKHAAQLSKTESDKMFKLLKDSEYEAVIIKPDRISFYISQGCASKYTEVELQKIKEKSNEWKL